MPAPRQTPRRQSRPAPLKEQARDLFDGYSEKRKPLGGYAALAAIFTAGLAGALAAVEKNDKKSPALTWSDLFLLGIATHKLSRVVTKDLVTSPFRAPFVKFKKSTGAGEVEEEARGEGLREAVGDLITCPYCIAPWIASAVVFAAARAPRATRRLAAIFAINAGSDFLNHLYARAKE